jgi:flagellar protein FliO/FliZ
MTLLVATGGPALAGDGELLRALVAVVVVLGLLVLGAWALQRGKLAGLAGFGGKAKALVRIEATVPLGDRRTLMVVAVEGRRLLLGLTPVQVSLVTELDGRAKSFDDALARATETPAPTAPS